MRKYITATIAVSIVAGLSVATTIDRAHAETEQTIDAIIAWIGNGRSYEVGPQAAMFVGSLTGSVYVETEKGLVPSGSATCPVMVDVDLATAVQKAQGRCLIENPDGNRIFAEVNCEGVYRVGCDGTITLTGGTGAFEGITGSGAVTVRSERRNFVETRSGVTEEEGAGIMIIDGLKYTLP